MADLISDLQRLRKHTSGHPDDAFMNKAFEAPRDGRGVALEEDEKKKGNNG